MEWKDGMGPTQRGARRGWPRPGSGWVARCSPLSGQVPAPFPAGSARCQRPSCGPAAGSAHREPRLAAAHLPPSPGSRGACPSRLVQTMLGSGSDRLLPGCLSRSRLLSRGGGLDEKRLLPGGGQLGTGGGGSRSVTVDEAAGLVARLPAKVHEAGCRWMAAALCSAPDRLHHEMIAAPGRLKPHIRMRGVCLPSGATWLYP